MNPKPTGWSQRYGAARRKHLKPGSPASWRAALELGRRTVAFGLETLALAVANRLGQRSGGQRKVMKDAFAKSGTECHQRLEESLELQNHWRQRTRQVLAAQEDDRKTISHELRDEIAQPPLGINVRLRSLKRDDRSNPNGFENEIASTQRLVVESAKSARCFARELNRHHETHRKPSIPIL